MKFRITFKTPDVVEDAIRKAVSSNSSSEEENDLDDLRFECEDVVEKFVKYNELITVEFDTESSTATVIKAK